MAESGIELNPSAHLPVYFTRKKDAEDYARTKYRNTLYFWEIRHTDKVISKEEVCKNERK